MSKQKSLKGFTLIEILVVVALIAILTAITFIAINPAKNFQDTRNAQRSADVTQILNAVTQYTSEQGNTVATLVAAAGGESLAIPVCPSTAPIGPGNATPAAVALEDALVDEYIVGIPRDPLNTSDTDADGYGYTICRTDGGRIEIAAPLAEENAGDPAKIISVKR